MDAERTVKGAQFARNDWQPIETAPKDGTHFLAYGDGMMVVGHFYDAHQKWGGFRLSHESGWESECDLEKPTHWMPLPVAPTRKET